VVITLRLPLLFRDKDRVTKLEAVSLYYAHTVCFEPTGDPLSRSTVNSWTGKKCLRHLY